MPTRRQTILGLGGIATAGAGIVLLSDDSTAIEITGLDIPNKAHTNKSGQLANILIQVNCSFSYDSNKALDRTELRLEASRDETFQPIAERVKTQTVPQSASKQVQLTGSLFDAAYSAEDFAVPNAGERTQHSIPIRVIFQAMKDSSIVNEQIAETNVTIVLEHAEELSISAELGGTGEVLFTDNK